jgi:methyl-accepting chemotaxis protein
MDDVVRAVKRVTDIIGEISAASDEQSAGIDEIGRAVMQMDSGTQQNAALVEQAAAAANALDEQAQALKLLVGRFRIAA